MAKSVAGWRLPVLVALACATALLLMQVIQSDAGAQTAQSAAVKRVKITMTCSLTRGSANSPCRGSWKMSGGSRTAARSVSRPLAKAAGVWRASAASWSGRRDRPAPAAEAAPAEESGSRAKRRAQTQVAAMPGEPAGNSDSLRRPYRRARLRQVDRARGVRRARRRHVLDRRRGARATRERRGARPLVERLGPEVAPDGTIDRAAVARHVFEHPEDREWLEQMLWARVGARVMEWRAEVDAVDPPPPAAVVETPLLFEAGMEAVYDHTIAIVADEEVRAERAGARGHEAVDERAGRQLRRTKRPSERTSRCTTMAPERS